MRVVKEVTFHKEDSRYDLVRNVSCKAKQAKMLTNLLAQAGLEPWPLKRFLPIFPYLLNILSGFLQNRPWEPPLT